MTTPSETPQPERQADGNPFDAFLAAAAKVGSMSLPVAVALEPEQASCDRRESPQPDLSLLNRSFRQRNMRQHTDTAEALKQAANVISEDGTIIGHLMKRPPMPRPTAPVAGERDSSRRVTVDAGALAMVRNALRRDAEEGKQARGEMLALLDASTAPAAQQPERRGPVAPEPVAVPHGFAEALRLAKVAVEECPTDAPMVMDWMEAAMKVCRLLAAPPAPSCEPQDAPLTWPQGRDIARLDDMSPNGHLRLTFDSDNDVCVEVYDDKEKFAGVEFCNGGGGGGQSPHTRAALVALMAAIERDNAERPIRAHPRFSGVAK